jgi:murein DD-endopeptidase MepM/ murein hydrolase activator NlpD
MSKLNFSNGKLGRFLSSKGFYAAVAACLLGAGAATWLAVNETVAGIEETNQELIESENEWTNYPGIEAEPPAAEVEKPQAGVPKPTSPTEPPRPLSDAPSPSSSPAPVSDAGAPSEPPAISVALPRLSYTLPVRDEILAHYSAGALVKNETLGDWRTHDGVDIAAAKGTEVLAAAGGTVAAVENDALWGTVITLAHPDGRETLYCGLSATVPVSEGDAVMQNQVIGAVDAIPCEIAEASHVHFAMRQGEEWVDPLEGMS